MFVHHFSSNDKNTLFDIIRKITEIPMVVKTEEEGHLEIDDLKFISSIYNVQKKAGEGTFSVVYKATHVKNKKEIPVAIKAITRTTSPSRIVEELSFLKELDGKDNCVKILGIYRNADQVCVVFPFVESSDFKTFLVDCKVRDIKHYIYNLALALTHCHAKKIIHRDLKPSNFLYSKETKSGTLIDFGLARYQTEVVKKAGKVLEEISVNKKQTILFYTSVVSRISQPPGYYVGDTRPVMRAQRVGTRGFRAPEVLFRSSNQTSAIDMWSTGVIMLILCTRQYPFFNSSDDIEALGEIGTIFGHSEMRKEAANCDRIWYSNLQTIPEQRISFEKIVESLNPELSLTSEGYDLLYRLLDLSAESRITAEEVLKHPFITDILI